MPKFKVTVMHTYTYEVTVEADDEDDAENEAIELVNSGTHPAAVMELDDHFEIDDIKDITEEVAFENKMAKEGR